MSEIIIREYQPEDREAVEKCILELQEDEYARRPYYWAAPTEALAKIYLDYTLEIVRKEADSKKIYVGIIDGKVCGWIVVHISTDESPDVVIKKYGYVSELTVLRECQKKGIGVALMAKAEEFVRSNGIELIELNVAPGNPALEFYHKLGYKNDSIRMEKRLNP